MQEVGEDGIWRMKEQQDGKKIPWNDVLWTYYKFHTHELTAAMNTCSRTAHGQAW